MMINMGKPQESWNEHVVRTRDKFSGLRGEQAV
jgi:hypothetical protein